MIWSAERQGAALPLWRKIRDDVDRVRRWWTDHQEEFFAALR